MKKLAIISFIASVFVITPVIAMYNTAFRVAQMITSGLVVGAGAKSAYDRLKEIKKPIFLQPASEKVTNLVHEELNKHIANPLDVPVVVIDSSSPWAVGHDKVIAVNRETAIGIESNNVKIIQQSISSQKHEIKHLLNRDGHKRAYAYFVAPCAVQAASSGLTYGFNTIFKRQACNTMRSFFGRSLVATGAVVPKLLLSAFGVFAYTCYQETEADRFACEHAESWQELGVFKGWLDELEKSDQKAMSKIAPGYADMNEKKQNFLMGSLQLAALMFMEDGEGFVRPRSADRSAMVQKYIDKWDEEHKN